MIYPRLKLLTSFLREDGSIFVHLDDNETDYAKLLLDELLGRDSFVARLSVKARSPSAFSTVNPGVFKAAEYILWYAKKKPAMWQDRVWVPRSPDTAYNKWVENPDASEAEWRIGPLGPVLRAALQEGVGRSNIETATKRFYVENARRIVRLAEIDDEGAGEDIVRIKGQSLKNAGVIFRHKRDGFEDIFIADGQQILFYEKNVRSVDGERTPVRMLTNIWDDIAWEGIAGEGRVTLRKGKKPERLLRRCLQLTTVPGDIVMDSFLGSGTTAAVALKMKRRFIGIERGSQAESHCATRLRNVVAGDKSGISRLEKWTGGGGFTFYRLGDPIFDESGAMRPGVRFRDLAAHIWFSETFTAPAIEPKGPYLGSDGDRGIALLFNGVLGDKRPDGGNVLTSATLRIVREAAGGFAGPLTIYGEASRLGPERLRAEQVAFKQTPYDVRTR